MTIHLTDDSLYYTDSKSVGAVVTKVFSARAMGSTVGITNVANIVYIIIQAAP
jgi:hypothetical protein